MYVLCAPASIRISVDNIYDNSVTLARYALNITRQLQIIYIL